MKKIDTEPKTANQKRDFIMSSLFNSDNSPKTIYYSMLVSPPKSHDTNWVEVEKYKTIAKQLIGDGYITKESKANLSDEVYPSLKGEDIWLMGGFVKQAERINAEQSLILKMAIWTQRLSSWTVVLGVATSGLLIVEIARFFCD